MNRYEPLAIHAGEIRELMRRCSRRARGAALENRSRRGDSLTWTLRCVEGALSAAGVTAETIRSPSTATSQFPAPEASSFSGDRKGRGISTRSRSQATTS
jgi:hypothetical protein